MEIHRRKLFIRNFLSESNPSRMGTAKPSSYPHETRLLLPWNHTVVLGVLMQTKGASQGNWIANDHNAPDQSCSVHTCLNLPRLSPFISDVHTWSFSLAIKIGSPCHTWPKCCSLDHRKTWNIIKNCGNLGKNGDVPNLPITMVIQGTWRIVIKVRSGPPFFHREIMSILPNCRII